MPEELPAGLYSFDYISPIGNLRGVLSSDGLLSLSLDRGNNPSIADRNTGTGTAPRIFHELTDQLDSYFEKELDAFTVDLDTSRISDFQKRVYKELRSVKFGNLITYGELARRSGVPGGARAVGGAMGSNPYLLVVPCHRVVSAGTSGRYDLGGFSAGLGIKKDLLTFEGTITALGWY